jgi:subtilisin family serine protease
MIGLPTSHRLTYGFLVSIATVVAATFASAEQAQSGRGGGSGSSRLVGIIVKLQDDPVVSYRGTIQGLAATSRDAPGAAPPSRGGPAIQAYRAHLAQKHAAFEAAAGLAVPAARVTHRFDIVLGGIAMRVPEDQVAKVAQLPGVTAVYRDPRLRLHTDTSPRFIGATTVWGRLQGHERAGEGIIIGVLDTGVWPEHPSFADPDASGKPYPPPPTPAAQCAFAGGANPGPSFTCNHKLIGAYRFMATYDECVAADDCELGGDFTSARDSDGHGTHTASTAAGNGKVESQVFGIDRKHISGIAPRAHVIAYKVCGPDLCFGSDAIAAVQQAILDGVDVINFSIGGGIDPYNDVVELVFRDAYAAGVFVAASAGNEGPAADTASHRGPWVTSVAASTENRSFQTTLSLVGAGDAGLRLTGVSITPGITTPGPVVIDGGDPFCDQATPVDLAGKIVVCERGGASGRLEKSFNAGQRGAAGMILVNGVEGQELLTDSHSIPSVHIAKASADALRDFLMTHANVTATFPISVARNAQGDVVAQFSSRGGTTSTLGISKPDITAPGVQILAAQTPHPLDPANPADQLFQAIAGTSMSSPHLAGAAALLKDLHPEWTPGQIKSALMTTASTETLVKDDGVTPFTPFDAGSGRVDLKAAQSPGLTFDVPASDYVDRGDDLWAVNYPSVFVPDVAPHTLIVRRTAQSVLPRNTQWTLSVIPDSSPGLVIAVPPTLTVPAGGVAAFDIHIDKTEIPAGQVRHATLRLASSSIALHMPITAAGAVARPDLIVTEVSAPSTGTVGEPISTAATVANVGSATATAFFFQVYLSRGDATVSADDTPFWFCRFASLAPGATGSCNFTFPVPGSIEPGSYHLVVRVDDDGVVSESNENNNVGSAGPIAIN